MEVQVYLDESRNLSSDKYSLRFINPSMMSTNGSLAIRRSGIGGLEFALSRKVISELGLNSDSSIIAKSGNCVVVAMQDPLRYSKFYEFDSLRPEENAAQFPDLIALALSPETIKIGMLASEAKRHRVDKVYNYEIPGPGTPEKIIAPENIISTPPSVLSKIGNVQEAHKYEDLKHQSLYHLIIENQSKLGTCLIPDPKSQTVSFAYWVHGNENLIVLSKDSRKEDLYFMQGRVQLLKGFSQNMQMLRRDSKTKKEAAMYETIKMLMLHFGNKPLS